MDYKKLFIDGKWVNSSSDTFIEVTNPADNSFIAHVPSANINDLNFAISSADKAFATWSSLSLTARLDYLDSLLHELTKFSQELTSVIVSELGCPVSFSYESQVISSIDEFSSLLDFAKKIDFEKRYDGYTLRREPFGIVACICPWNYPLYQLVLKVIPALICGNTVILKPASITPMSAYYFAEAVRLANLPEGVFNLITGSGSLIGRTMAEHEKIDMVSFTGSTAVGKDIIIHSASTVKKISLELGGKSPCLVLENADYSLAVDTVLDSCFLNSGQTCSAFTRMYVPISSKEKILDLIRDRIDKYVSGNPLDPNFKLGSMSSLEQSKIVRSYINSAISQGAKIITCKSSDSSLSDTFINPCVLFDVSDDMEIAKAEIFGPVLSVITYDDLEYAIKKCNDSPYGLSSCIFGDEKEALSIAKKLKAGNVHINASPFITGAPFGGYKQSGLGREGGELGILEFTEVKAIFH